MNKYAALLNNILANNYEVTVLVLEVGYHGYNSCDNDITVKKVYQALSIPNPQHNVHIIHMQSSNNL